MLAFALGSILVTVSLQPPSSWLGTYRPFTLLPLSILHGNLFSLEADILAASFAFVSSSSIFVWRLCSSLLWSLSFACSLVYFEKSMWSVTDFRWVARCIFWVSTVLLCPQWGQVTLSRRCFLPLFFWRFIVTLVVVYISFSFFGRGQDHRLVSTQDR